MNRNIGEVWKALILGSSIVIAASMMPTRFTIEHEHRSNRLHPVQVEVKTSRSLY